MGKSLCRFFFRALLVVFCQLAVSTTSSAEITITVSFGPPPLPRYIQPPCPHEGYIWIPGYWAWDGEDYYWVPGTWVSAPVVGYLWTPPYWAWSDGIFIFHEGYWAPQVGFYGGIVYGFGYYGSGFYGGRWVGGRYYYNRSVTNVVNVTNVYNESVPRTTVNYVSYNGGPGGITARPTPQDQTIARERHIGPVAAQTQQVQAARTDPALKAFANRGKPPIAATPVPGAFNDRAAVAAREAGGVYNPPVKRIEPNRASGIPPGSNRADNRGAPSRGNQANSAPQAAPNFPPADERRAASNGRAGRVEPKQQQPPQQVQSAPPSSPQNQVQHGRPRRREQEPPPQAQRRPAESSRPEQGLRQPQPEMQAPPPPHGQEMRQQQEPPRQESQRGETGNTGKEPPGREKKK